MALSVGRPLLSRQCLFFFVIFHVDPPFLFQLLNWLHTKVENGLRWVELGNDGDAEILNIVRGAGDQSDGVFSL